MTHPDHSSPALRGASIAILIQISTALAILAAWCCR
jgi:hypothetical protein